MEKSRASILDKAKEYVTHWSVAGLILAATGAAPEHWFAELVQELHVPYSAVPEWASHVDYRLVAVAVGLSIIVGDSLWRHHGRVGRAAVTRPTASAPTMSDRKFPPPPDQPSIAVLPFTNVGGEPEQEYFSDGVADDIITELSRDRSLFVMARNSSFSFRGHAVDIKDVARQLGVRYVIEGSVRREAGRVRISAQLIDATTGNHIWADRYDRPLEDVFAVQDEIASSVTAAISPALAGAEQKRALRRPPGSLTAWEAYQRGLWNLARSSPEDNELARIEFRKAIELDANFAPPRVGIVLTYLFDVLFHGNRTFLEAAPLMIAEARKAVSIDANDSDAHAALADAFVALGDYDAATDSANRALALNKNSALAHLVVAVNLVHNGRMAEGREEALTCLRLNPRDPRIATAAGAVAVSYYNERNYPKALEAARRCLADYPNYAGPRRILAAALGQLGRRDEAVDALREWKATSPGTFKTFVGTRPPYIRTADHEHFLEGLRKAGWASSCPQA